MRAFWWFYQHTRELQFCIQRNFTFFDPWMTAKSPHNKVIMEIIAAINENVSDAVARFINRDADQGREGSCVLQAFSRVLQIGITMNSKPMATLSDRASFVKLLRSMVKVPFTDPSICWCPMLASRLTRIVTAGRENVIVDFIK